MLVCSKCGYDNTLGKVFCDRCGQKLDLDSITSDAIAAKFKWDRLLRYLPIAAGVVALIAAVLAGVSYWPREGTIGMKGTRGGGERVQTSLNAIGALKSGQKLDAEFSEQDINGYLEFFKLKDMKADSISVAVTDNFVAVRVIRRLTSIGVWNFSFVPTVSYDLLCLPMGGQLIIRRAAMGHLPLSGPWRVRVCRKVYQMFAEQPELKQLSGVNAIQLSSGKVRVSVGK